MAKRKKVEKAPEKYELPKACDFKGFRILSVDPGSKNFGISVVGTKNNKPVVLANAVLMYPINSLVEFTERYRLFCEEIDRWVKVFKPQAIIGERFQTRGNGGPLIELVSVMLGVLAGRYKLPTRLITASTWKNKFCRRFSPELAAMYPEVAEAVDAWSPPAKSRSKTKAKIKPEKKPRLDLPLMYGDLQMTPHAFDACLIGIYGLEYGFGRDLQYTPKSIVKQAEAASRLPLKPSPNSRRRIK